MKGLQPSTLLPSLMMKILPKFPSLWRIFLPLHSLPPQSLHLNLSRKQWKASIVMSVTKHSIQTNSCVSTLWKVISPLLPVRAVTRPQSGSTLGCRQTCPSSTTMHVMHVPATSHAVSIHQQWHNIVANWQYCKKCGYYTAYIQLVNNYSGCFGWNTEKKGVLNKVESHSLANFCKTLWKW